MMSHLCLLLFLLPPELIYLLDCVRGDAGKTGLEALSYAKFTSLMITLPGAIAGKVGRTRLCKSAGRQQQPFLLTPGSFTGKSTAPHLGRALSSRDGFTLPCQWSLGGTPMPVTRV